MYGLLATYFLYFLGIKNALIKLHVSFIKIYCLITLCLSIQVRLFFLIKKNTELSFKMLWRTGYFIVIKCF